MSSFCVIVFIFSLMYRGLSNKYISTSWSYLSFTSIKSLAFATAKYVNINVEQQIFILIFVFVILPLSSYFKLTIIVCNSIYHHQIYYQSVNCINSIPKCSCHCTIRFNIQSFLRTKIMIFATQINIVSLLMFLYSTISERSSASYLLVEINEGEKEGILQSHHFYHMQLLKFIVSINILTSYIICF